MDRKSGNVQRAGSFDDLYYFSSAFVNHSAFVDQLNIVQHYTRVIADNAPYIKKAIKEELIVDNDKNSDDDEAFNLISNMNTSNTRWSLDLRNISSL